MSKRQKKIQEKKEKSGEVEDVRQEEGDGKAGDQDSFEKKIRGLLSGRLTIHTHSTPSVVTFVRHSVHSSAKTHMCRHMSTLKQIP